MSNPLEPPSALKEAAAEWIARLDAGLSTAEQAQFNVWLAADPRHRSALDWYRGPWAALDRPVQAGVADDVLARVRALDGRQRQRRRRVASALAAAAVLLGGVTFWQISLRSSRDTAAPIATAKLVLPARQVLPDSTTVDLKDGAEIVVGYTADARRVTLRSGEAHFQVARDAAKPFIVSANGVEFRAVGTAFSVQLGIKEVELLVTEGSVAVDQPAARSPHGQSPSSLTPGPQTLATVVAGNRLTVPVQNPNAIVPAPVVASAAEIGERLSWRAPRLEFTGTPLAEAVALLNRQLVRQNQGSLVIADPSIEQIKISGLFRADNTAALIDLLETGFGITAERRGDSEIVLRRAP